MSSPHLVRIPIIWNLIPHVIVIIVTPCSVHLLSPVSSLYVSLLRSELDQHHLSPSDINPIRRIFYKSEKLIIKLNVVLAINVPQEDQPQSRYRQPGLLYPNMVIGLADSMIWPLYCAILILSLIMS